MRKTTTLLICSLFWLSATIAFAGENIMKVHDATGLSGENIAIELEILNDDPFVAFEVHFDLPVGFGYVPGSVSLNPGRKADHIVQAAIHGGTGKLVIIAFSLTNAWFIGNSGVIATFSLTTPEIAGTYPLIPENGIIAIPDGTNIFTGYFNGVLTITSGTQTLPGDSNCDGEVNILDVITKANYITGNNPQPFCFENADVNGDGIVDVGDLIGTINIIIDNFVCGISTIADYDGNLYNTVLIGDQCWIKENLKTTKYRNGTPIAYPGTNNFAWQTNYTGAYAWYNNDINWKESYGALYNWHAVTNINGLCPSGWHVPSDTEWTQLVDYVVAQGFPNNEVANGTGNALKSCRQVNSPLSGDCNTSEHPRWGSHSTNYGFDEFGFSVLPGGSRFYLGDFSSIATYGNWWSFTEDSSTNAWHRRMRNSLGNVARIANHKRNGYSVRCLKDASFANIPSVTTSPIIEITSDSAVSGGSVVDDGGADITARGIVWSATENPTFYNNIGLTNEGIGIGVFTSTLSGLNPETEYFVRAYATNYKGTAYGYEFSFITLENLDGQPCPETPTVTDIDGNVYNTVLIGEQCWMKENLKTTKYRNGTPIEYPGDDNTAWETNTTGAYAWYDNDVAWKDIYGGLYNWFAATNAAGLCPTGWRVPTTEEFEQLFTFVGGSHHGQKLKSCRQVNTPMGGECITNEHPRWNYWSINIYGTDETGFSGLPGGLRFSYGESGFLGVHGRWWTSTSHSTQEAINWVMTRSTNFFTFQNTPRQNGQSIRCLRDEVRTED